MSRILVIGGCGYIGSALHDHLTREGFRVDTVDLELFGNYTNPRNERVSFATLTRSKLAEYDCIIHLAAHSSVQMAMADHPAALQNNVVDFERLLSRLDDQKLIYASSSSVYTGSNSEAVSEECANFNVGTIYDLTKYCGDALAYLSKRHFYGLRFGTVCGSSKNLRTDVMINKMVRTALEKGRIEVYNASVHRPILGLRDLCRAVTKIVRGGDHRGIYNLASFNSTVKEIAAGVAQAMNVEVCELGTSPTYDFSMSTVKFERVYDFRFEETISGNVDSLRSRWNDCIRGDRGGVPLRVSAAA